MGRGKGEGRGEGNESIDRGDFNARMEKEEGRVEEEQGGTERTRKEGRKIGKLMGEGKKLCRFLKEYGWHILNGEVRGDEAGE